MDSEKSSKTFNLLEKNQNFETFLTVQFNDQKTILKKIKPKIALLVNYQKHVHKKC